MNKKMVKVFSTILMVIMVVSISVSSFAANANIIKPINITPVAPTDNSIQNVGGKLMGILQTVGVVLSVIVLIILGIKYMMGSAEEKAEYKKTMLPYVVGAALIFGASALANTIYGLATSITVN